MSLAMNPLAWPFGTEGVLRTAADLERRHSWSLPPVSSLLGLLLSRVSVSIRRALLGTVGAAMND